MTETRNKMTETKPLPTITEKAIGDTCNPFCGQFHYCEKWINAVLLAHEEKAKEQMDYYDFEYKGTSRKILLNYWRGRRDAVQSLRGDKNVS